VESVNQSQLIHERDGVIKDRRAAIVRWANAGGDQEKRRIHGEFIQPLTAELLKLNRRLGV
jgi:hypothetical protein